MKYLFIGDIHGRIDQLVKATEYAYSIDAVPVYMGDLVDSITESKLSQLNCIKYITLQLEQEKAWCLIGNHDLSYISPYHRCSGYSRSKQNLFTGHHNGMALQKWINHERTVFFIWFDKQKVLATHAGLDSRIVSMYKDPIEWLEQEFEDSTKAIYGMSTALHCGKENSGTDPVSGIVWARPASIHSPWDFTQVVGHTPHDTCTYYSNHKMWCIDTLEYGDNSVLLMDDEGNFEVIKEY